MLLNGFSKLNLGTPTVGPLPSLQGMSSGMIPPVGDPTLDVKQDALSKFGNWTGQTDTKVMAQDLKRRGLIGADSLIDDTARVNTNDPYSIRNSESDWKVSAIQQIVANAKKLNLRKPEEILANKDVLVSNPRWRDAINNTSFQHIHPNFWNILTNSIIPEQYAKFDKENSVAKK